MRLIVLLLLLAAPLAAQTVAIPCATPPCSVTLAWTDATAAQEGVTTYYVRDNLTDVVSVNVPLTQVVASFSLGLHVITVYASNAAGTLSPPSTALNLSLFNTPSAPTNVTATPTSPVTPDPGGFGTITSGQQIQTVLGLLSLGGPLHDEPLLNGVWMKPITYPNGEAHFSEILYLASGLWGHGLDGNYWLWPVPGGTIWDHPQPQRPTQ